tara:strand:+ start:167 stop:949 length:783 start_codon:yes stop_codon:yes gene_type:complete
MSVEPKKRGRKPKKKPYFGPEEEEAVKKYLELGTIIKDPNTQDGYRWTGTTHEDIQRNKIYLKQLKAPLDKMVESIIRRYKLYSKTMEFEDLHADTLGFLHVKFHKFKPAKNKKSYSYYGTVVKHYLLGKLIKEDKKMKQNLNFDDVSSALEEKDELIYTIDDDGIDLSKLIDGISESIKKEMEDRVLNENEVKVGRALTSILDGWEVLFDDDNVPGGNKFNKNLILYYMREMTSLNTKDIRNAMKRYKTIYNILKEESF